MKITILFFIAAFQISGFAQQNWTLRYRAADSLRSFAIAGRPSCYIVSTKSVPAVQSAFYDRLFLRSFDGINWEKLTLPQADFFVDAGNVFVGVGPYLIWTSQNGSSVLQSYDPGDQFRSPVGISIGNGMWVIAYSNGRILHAADPAGPWIESITPEDTMFSICFSHGKFRARSYNANCISEDGINWTSVPTTWGDDIVSFGLDKYFSIYGFSSDGDSWTQWGFYPFTPHAFAVGPETMVISSGSDLAETKDFVNLKPLSISTSSPIDRIGYCGDLWVATTAGGHVFTSNASQSPLVAPSLTLTPAIELAWPSILGRQYQIQSSSNGTVWADFGSPMMGNSSTLRFNSTTSAQRQFFRVSVR